MVIVMEVAEAVARVGPGLGMQPGGADAKKWRKVSNYIMIIFCLYFVLA